MSKDDQGAKPGYRVLTVIAAAAGTFAARKLLAAVWKVASGKEPPANPEHPEVTWPEAVSWAVVSGAVMGLARLTARKKVAQSWQRSTGALPPGLTEEMPI